MFELAKRQPSYLTRGNLFRDDFVDDFFNIALKKSELERKFSNAMKTNSHYDVEETDEFVFVNLFIPKIENILKEDISVSFENNILKVEIENEKEQDSKTNIPNSFYMKYSMYNSGYNIDKDKIEAKIENNALKIKMPKIDKSLKIEVK